MNTHTKKKKTKSRLWRLPLLSALKNGGRQGVDRALLLYILLLIAFGSVMVFSASTAYASIRFSNPYYFVERQILWVLVGLLAMLLCASFPISFYARAAKPLFIATTVLLALVPFLGAEAGGAKRWIAIGGFTFQPSELAKTALVLILALFFSKHTKEIKDTSQKKKSFLYGILYPLLLIFAVCGLVALEKHLSCIIILGAIGVFMMFLAGSNLKTLGLLGAGAVTAVGAFAMSVEYTRRRITIWLNPELYPRDGGWQTLQGLLAIGSGGFFGLGLGNSRLKYLYVSEPQNDFIFTIACEELGFLGAFAILGLFALFVKRGMRIADRQRDTFASLVAFGITVKVAIQVILNIAVITNTIPNTGISLPFFSYGGSSLVMLFAEMGVLLSASRDAYI